jgi:hypothetical protein
MFLGSEVQLVHRANKLATIFELIVYTIWDPNISEPYRPPWPVMGIAF